MKFLDTSKTSLLIIPVQNKIPLSASVTVFKPRGSTSLKYKVNNSVVERVSDLISNMKGCKLYAEKITPVLSLSFEQYLISTYYESIVNHVRLVNSDFLNTHMCKGVPILGNHYCALLLTKNGDSTVQLPISESKTLGLMMSLNKYLRDTNLLQDLFINIQYSELTEESLIKLREENKLISPRVQVVKEEIPPIINILSTLIETYTGNVSLRMDDSDKNIFHLIYHQEIHLALDRERKIIVLFVTSMVPYRTKIIDQIQTCANKYYYDLFIKDNVLDVNLHSIGNNERPNSSISTLSMSQEIYTMMSRYFGCLVIEKIIADMLYILEVPGVMRVTIGDSPLSVKAEYAVSFTKRKNISKRIASIASNYSVVILESFLESQQSTC